MFYKKIINETSFITNNSNQLIFQKDYANYNDGIAEDHDNQVDLYEFDEDMVNSESVFDDMESNAADLDNQVDLHEFDEDMANSEPVSDDKIGSKPCAPPLGATISGCALALGAGAPSVLFLDDVETLCQGF